MKQLNWNFITSTSFVVILPNAHLTSHSRMSGSRWVITPSWLSGSWRSFLYSSSVYSCHLFLISSASVRSIPFLSFIEPIFAWNVPFVSLIFLRRSLVIRWPNYWSFSFSISLSNEHSGLISFRIDWFDLLAVQETDQLDALKTAKPTARLVNKKKWSNFKEMPHVKGKGAAPARQ